MSSSHRESMYKQEQEQWMLFKVDVARARGRCFIVCDFELSCVIFKDTASQGRWLNQLKQ